MEIKTANTILYCKNFSNTVEFYRDALGLPVTAEFDWFVEFRLNENSRLSVADEGRSRVKSAGGAGITITMMVADVIGARRELGAAGLVPGPVKKHKWGAEVFYLHDPEGNRLEFWAEG